MDADGKAVGDATCVDPTKCHTKTLECKGTPKADGAACAKAADCGAKSLCANYVKDGVKAADAKAGDK